MRCTHQVSNRNVRHQRREINSSRTVRRRRYPKAERDPLGGKKKPFFHFLHFPPFFCSFVFVFVYSFMFSFTSSNSRWLSSAETELRTRECSRRCRGWRVRHPRRRGASPWSAASVDRGARGWWVGVKVGGEGVWTLKTKPQKVRDVKPVPSPTVTHEAGWYKYFTYLYEVLTSCRCGREK